MGRRGEKLRIIYLNYWGGLEVFDKGWIYKWYGSIFVSGR